MLIDIGTSGWLVVPPTLPRSASDQQIPERGAPSPQGERIPTQVAGEAVFNILPCSTKVNAVVDRTQQRTVEDSMAEAMSSIHIEFTLRRWLSDQEAIVDVGRQGFGTTYRLIWLPHVTLSALARHSGYNAPHPILVAGPRIGSRTAAALRQAQIDFIDTAGNAHLDFGPVLIDIRGRDNPALVPNHRSPESNLFSAKRMQVVFALLTWPGLVEQPVRTVAHVAGTSVGIAQSALEGMRQFDYLIGPALRRRDELVDLWSAAYRSTLMPKVRQASYQGDVSQWSPPLGYLVSGESAVNTIRHPQTLAVYVKNFDPIEAVHSRWRRTDHANIEVRHKFWNEPPWSEPRDPTGAFTESAAPPLLVYADLLASKEPRQAEVAHALRRDGLV
ncbi:type IV toxin-antitoxin system AbiEi family antitoxin [Nocardia thailandica]|uniref:type IV toxin-antitoxin system AbiEi family antitoxin n=1 Tax=Nocardia thailandica TaxID=257275 RepID=UPI0012F8CBA1|nr:type IV toxin-antitoxin system AbiEi family antitoxin [Nocardia thailandica]